MTSTRKRAAGIPALSALAVACAVALPTAQARGAEVIELTQTGCQFLEPEGVDQQFKTTKAADCEAINAETGAGRVQASEVLTLRPGSYVFRVRNRDVPYELGFWLRDEGYDWKNPLHKVTKTSVSGGGLKQGQSLDYEVELKPGTYVYSCPLNPTPDYKIVVSAE